MNVLSRPTGSGGAQRCGCACGAGRAGATWIAMAAGSDAGLDGAEAGDQEEQDDEDELSRVHACAGHHASAA